MITRRLLLTLPFAPFPARGTFRPPRSPLDAAAPGANHASVTALYRVDAVILLFGVPIFSRSGVGGGYAIAGESASSRSLQFAAGSVPSRARGLNRLGFIHEVCGPEGSRYFGFMTASGEESFAEARRALEEPGGEEAPYTAISGHVGGGLARSRVCRFLFPARLSWADWDRLLPAACAAFEDSSGGEPETARPCSGRFQESFLAALHRAMLAGPGRAEYSFVYGARDLTLQASVNRDAKLAFLRLEGKIFHGAKTLSSFRLWYSPSRLVPERIEIQPRSFLRLVLRAEPPPA